MIKSLLCWYLLCWPPSSFWNTFLFFPGFTSWPPQTFFDLFFCKSKLFSNLPAAVAFLMHLLHFFIVLLDMGIASCHIQIHPRCSSILLRGWFLCNCPLIPEQFKSRWLLLCYFTLARRSPQRAEQLHELFSGQKRTNERRLPGYRCGGEAVGLPEPGSPAPALRKHPRFRPAQRCRAAGGQQGFHLASEAG